MCAWSRRPRCAGGGFLLVAGPLGISALQRRPRNSPQRLQPCPGALLDHTSPAPPRTYESFRLEPTPRPAGRGMAHAPPPGHKRTPRSMARPMHPAVIQPGQADEQPQACDSDTDGDHCSGDDELDHRWRVQAAWPDPHPILPWAALWGIRSGADDSVGLSPPPPDGATCGPACRSEA